MRQVSKRCLFLVSVLLEKERFGDGLVRICRTIGEVFN